MGRREVQFLQSCWSIKGRRLKPRKINLTVIIPEETWQLAIYQCGLSRDEMVEIIRVEGVSGLSNKVHDTHYWLPVPLKAQPRHLKCEECGARNETVTKGVDPYLQEIHGEELKIQWCENCYVKASDEI